MILTNCAYCAAPLTHTYFVHCARCYTRYCGSHCLEQHLFIGTHLDHCDQIERGGGAEQYHADTKSAEAAVVAVDRCAEDTKGQTCYICFDGGEGLVRGCACRGTAGSVHVSCLAEQAKILVAEAEENNLDWKAKNARWLRWETCRLCEQDHHGVVLCALGWACWKTYVGRPEGDWARRRAMTLLGIGLMRANHHEDALSVQEAQLSEMRRLGASEEAILTTQGNLAISYQHVGRFEEALRVTRDVYHGYSRLLGNEYGDTLRLANNYASSLVCVKRFEEAKALLREMMPVARRVLGEDDRLTLKMRWNYAKALFKAPSATLDDLREAVTTLEDVGRITLRVLGTAHPLTQSIELHLRTSRDALHVREGDDVNPVCEAVEAMTTGDA